jgi:hypothetical protein
MPSITESGRKMAATETLKTVIDVAKSVKEMVIEECAQVADEHSSPPFGHDDPVAVNYWHLGEAYACKEIAAAIRALKK